MSADIIKFPSNELEKTDDGYWRYTFTFPDGRVMVDFDNPNSKISEMYLALDRCKVIVLKMLNDIT